MITRSKVICSLSGKRPNASIILLKQTSVTVKRKTQKIFKEMNRIQCSLSGKDQMQAKAFPQGKISQKEDSKGAFGYFLFHSILFQSFKSALYHYYHL